MKLKLLLILICALAIFARGYHYQERFAFDHDSDLSAWIVKDISIDNHHRLIGQLTSAPGVFIGSYFYYSLIPFFASANMDPLGTVSYPWLVGIIGVLSMYFVVTKIHNPKAGLIAAFFYAASFGISVTERQVVPTMWIFVWSIWFYYAICRLFAGDSKSLIIHAVLFSLVWHIQFNLAILIPLVIVGFVINIRKLDFKSIITAIALFLFLSIPLIGFEVRHNFSQTRSIFSSVSAKEGVIRTPVEKLDHVLKYVDRNVTYIFLNTPVTFVFLVAFLFLIHKKLLSKSQIFIYLLWFGLFVAFFVIHPINLSEYYLNALNVLWMILLALFLSSLPLVIPVVVLSAFGLINIHRIINHTTNNNGYLQKKQLIEFVKKDALANNYPCVAISYITDRGYDLGYRYLLWHANVKTAPIPSNAPVYSVVFPLSRVDRVDQSFDSLGLVLPEHAKYTNDSVTTSCAGPDFNLQDSMFGFTK